MGKGEKKLRLLAQLFCSQGIYDCARILSEAADMVRMKDALTELEAAHGP